MRQQVITAFDDYAIAGVVVYTSQELNRALGQYDQLSIAAIIDNVSGSSGTFDLWVEHSPDSRNWVKRIDKTQAVNPTTYTSSTGDMQLTSLAQNATTMRVWSDACQSITISAADNTGYTAGPLLPFVRLAIKVGTVNAHVRVICTGRGP